MNVEIGAEAALFPEKEYINRIAVAVQGRAKISCASMASPTNPNQQTKEGPFSFVVLESPPFTYKFQQSAGATPL
jgi:hypothetical protein